MRRVFNYERNHCASHMELLLRFVLWMQAERQRGREPSRVDIEHRFQLDDSTAYRWRRAYYDAINKPLPRSAATDRTTAAPAPRISP